MFQAIFQDRKTGLLWVSHEAKALAEWAPMTNEEGFLAISGNRPWDNSSLQLVGFRAPAKVSRSWKVVASETFEKALLQGLQRAWAVPSLRPVLSFLGGL